MNNRQLITAIQIISEINKYQTLTAIEFEDGSGKKFNYKLKGSNVWIFIDLTQFM